MEDVKSKYKEAQERAWKYVESEVLVDKDHFERWEREAEAAIKGEEFNEIEPHFDNEKVQFNGVDMFNSFMKGYSYCKKQYNLGFGNLDMFDNLRFGARFKTRSGIDAIFLFKNICHDRCFLNFVIDKKSRDELYLEQIVTDSKGFVDNPNHPCDYDIVERIY